MPAFLSADTFTGLGMISSLVAPISGARARRSAAMVVLTATIAWAPARPRRLRARFARMYGIIGSAAGQSAPARGRTHCVIIPAEQPGQSFDSSVVWMRSDQ